MSLKGDGIRSASFRRYSLAIILGTSVSWASAGALAQEAAPAAPPLTAPIASSSLEGPVSSNAPHLVIGMLEPGGAPSYSSLQTPQAEATSPSASAALAGVAGLVALNRNEKAASPRVLLSSLDSLAAEMEGVTNCRLQSISGRQTVQRSYDVAAAKPYSLLNQRPVAESFLYGSSASYLPSQEDIASDSESFTSNPAQGPLLQLQLGSSSLPVTLYSAPVAR